ncbi:MAG TPA: protein kinase [Kofleriaceae bacterium]|nr:protein kinase [Kofleriaceae bacterium]
MIEVGSIVGGKFRIDRILGRGGMGVVAVATHLQLEQQVALKVVHDALAGDPEIVERFLREARASARLRSEHVCKVSDVGQLDTGAPYIVMELLEGNDLAVVLADGALPVAIAADYVLQACVAVAEAHALGIVHRDLKPANLFLTRRLDGTPLIKVLDFGIAKAASTSDFKITRTQTVMGSPGYMSPEQLRSAREAEPRSDIWALGVILYELVTGRLPFDGDSVTELAVKVVMDPPAPLGLDAPAFERIVLRCLEKAPEQRYPNIAALAADLSPLTVDAGGRSISMIAAIASPPATGRAATGPVVSGKATTLQTAAAQSTGGPLPPAPPRRSTATLVVGGLALAAVVAAIAVFALRRSGPEDSARPAIAAVPSAPLDARIEPPSGSAAPSTGVVSDATIEVPTSAAVDAAVEPALDAAPASAPPGKARPTTTRGTKPASPPKTPPARTAPVTPPSHRANDDDRRTPDDNRRDIDDDHREGDEPRPDDGPDGRDGTIAGDADLGEAMRAASGGEWDKALAHAQAVLQRMPRNGRALTIGVTAACHLRRESVARPLLRRMPLHRQRVMRQLCAREGVLL